MLLTDKFYITLSSLLTLTPEQTSYNKIKVSAPSTTDGLRGEARCQSLASLPSFLVSLIPILI